MQSRRQVLHDQVNAGSAAAAVAMAKEAAARGAAFSLKDFCQGDVPRQLWPVLASAWSGMADVRAEAPVPERTADEESGSDDDEKEKEKDVPMTPAAPVYDEEAMQADDGLDVRAAADDEDGYDGLVTTTPAPADSSRNRSMMDTPTTSTGSVDWATRAAVVAWVQAELDATAGTPAADDAAVKMLPLVQTMHDGLLAMGSTDRGQVVQSDVAGICEQWFKEERHGRETLLPQTMAVLLIRALDESATPGDIKRVYGMRAGLLMLDFDDAPSIISIKHLLMRCLISPHFLRSSDGTRFLSFLFVVHTGFTDELHCAVKNQLGTASRPIVEAYANIYFRAWKSASGDFLLKLENSCIQELMNHAIHAAHPAMAKQLRIFLSAFHENKKQRDVDAMLLRLYEPILWRSLKVANATVRANAAAILVDAFPLQDPSAPVGETDRILQQQFDLLNGFLGDASVDVRRTGVLGISRILGVFWELMPLDVAAGFLRKLCTIMVSDAAAPAVRAAVFEGLGYVLDNRLSHPVLKELLPKLAPAMNDKAERVRYAMVRLLCQIKAVRNIRFYEVVPLDDLLARLATDSPRIRLGLVKLLVNSYFPVDKPTSQQISRGLALFRRNRRAALHFYASLADIEIPTGTIAKFIAALYNYMLTFDEDEDEDEGESEDELDEDGEPVRSRKRKTAAATTPEELAELRDVLSNFVSVMAVLWDSISRDLAKTRGTSLHYLMVETFRGDGLAVLMTKFADNDDVRLAVMKMASLMPKNALPAISAECLPALAEADVEDATDFGPLLDCLVGWDQTDKVLEQVVEYLDTAQTEMESILAEAGALADEDDDGSHKRSKKSGGDDKKAMKARRKAMKASQLKVRRAVAYLRHMLANPDMRLAVLDCPEQVDKLLYALPLFLDSIELFLRPDAPSHLRVDKDLLLNVLETYGKLVMHGRAAAETQEARDLFASKLDEVLAWTNGIIVPRLESILGDDALDTDAAVAALEARTRKRGADDDEENFRTPFAFRLVEIVLVLAADSLTLGLCNDGFANSLAEVARAILDLRAPALLVHIVPFVSKCMFQLCESENVDRYQVISILATLLAKMPDIAAVRAPVQALLETLISRCITNGDLMNLLTVLARSSVDAMSIEAADENESDEDEDEEADAATQARALAKSKKDMRRTAIDRLPCAASIVGKVIVSSRIPGVHEQFMLCIAQSITEGDLASVLRMSRLLMAMQSVVALPPAVHSALRAVRGNVLAGNFADEANGIEPSAVAPVLETILSRVH